ncbi:MAG: DUF5110 domain-containing protein, partial [Alphaproteobacteria bacterium]|nr:DUF5110 domain-containing protein [Alphaproteobacteria bacterium]
DLYDDDGVSYDYERGDYSRLRLEVIRDDRGELAGRTVELTPGALKRYTAISWSFRRE